LPIPRRRAEGATRRVIARFDAPRCARRETGMTIFLYADLSRAGIVDHRHSAFSWRGSSSFGVLENAVHRCSSTLARPFCFSRPIDTPVSLRSSRGSGLGRPFCGSWPMDTPVSLWSSRVITRGQRTPSRCRGQVAV